MMWLEDGNRFIWESERNGFKNYYLYDFNAGKLFDPITKHQFEVAGIVRVDEARTRSTTWRATATTT